VALSKIWVGAGKKDDATPADLVAVLIKEVGLQRPEIGRIELRDTFSLVEVPSEKADLVAKALTGLTVRRRRLTARVDRGMPERGGDRPPRGGSGGGRPSGPRGGGRPPRFDR
jgi:ATP-dependent RNA helicase DeaD